MPKVKFYAVRRGRQGARIYSTWDECRTNTEKFPGAQHRSFNLYEEAVVWINEGTHGASSRISHQSGKKVIDLTDDDDDDDLGVEDAIKDLDDDFHMMSQHQGFGAKSAPIDLTSSEGVGIDVDGGARPRVVQEPALLPPMDVTLSPEQRAVLDRVKDGYSVFFTGSAGTGKSVLLREIIRSQGGRASDCLGITASTGIAALNIGGTTLHSWAGIGLGKEPVKQLAGKIIFYEGNRQVLKRWRKTRTLIIDEISMIDGKLFEKLEEVARIVREKHLPFGGIQLILCGDFCQLPPVPDRINGKSVPATFAFDAKCWHTCVGEPITLTQVFRQKDQRFVDMLNEMRFGKIRPETVRVFRGLSREIRYTDGIEPTELFPLRAEVDRANEKRLQALPGDLHLYISTDVPGFDSEGKEVPRDQAFKLLSRLVSPREVKLRVGAQVMLIKNLVQGKLVNGSVGQVVGFSGMDEAKQNHPGIIVSDDPYNEGPQRRAAGVVSNSWPIVTFTNGMTVLCVPNDFTVNNASQGMEASRSQIPLILAWALSMHKSQGQTLERVKVNLARTFEKGQAYVALSRATRLETLQVLYFDPAKVLAHPRVLEWMGLTQEDSRRSFGN